MKKLFIFSCIGMLLISLTACHVETSTSYGLKIQNAVLAKKTNNNKITPVKNATFKRGDTIYYVLLNVSGFKKGPDKLNNFDIDMKITAPDGKTLGVKKGLLGNKGHIDLPNNTAASPHGIFQTSKVLKPGRYKIKLTIYDKVGKGSASKSTSFMLQ